MRNFKLLICIILVVFFVSCKSSTDKIIATGVVENVEFVKPSNMLSESGWILTFKDGTKVGVIENKSDVIKKGETYIVYHHESAGFLFKENYKYAKRKTK